MKTLKLMLLGLCLLQSTLPLPGKYLSNSKWNSYFLNNFGCSHPPSSSKVRPRILGIQLENLWHLPLTTHFVLILGHSLPQNLASNQTKCLPFLNTKICQNLINLHAFTQAISLTEEEFQDPNSNVLSSLKFFLALCRYRLCS